VLEYNTPFSSCSGSTVPLSCPHIGANMVFGQSAPTGSACAAGQNGLCGPTGVAVDGRGNLYVADFGNNRVLEYDAPPANSPTGFSARATSRRMARTRGPRGFRDPAR